MTFKDFVINLLGGQAKRRIENVHALREITLTLGEGTRLGIIGHNGAGKSTLLRTMAGIFPIEQGRRNVEGHLCSLFDITLGFDRETTGWDNIYHRAYLQGETPRSLRGKIEEIAEFTELGSFLDLPLKCYSAGMVMRLAFAIATANRPEILLIDEVFGTGDLGFRVKAKQRLTDLIDSAKIIVMVGHDLASIESFCDNVIWMEQGRIKLMGNSRDVIAAYQQAAAVFPSTELVARYRGPADENMYIGRLLRLGEEVRAEIAKSIDGRWQLLSSVPVARSSGRLRFDVIGGELRLYLDNLLLVESEDHDLTRGSVGLRSSHTGGSFERFSARGISHVGPRHPLGGELLRGPWQPIFGRFIPADEGWTVSDEGPALTSLQSVDAADVSISCDVNLPAPTAVLTMRSTMPVGAAA
ncbi:ATP-binding cassette domain-containing protein [bacterium]|nr:ATP-binding cassette domain-containing protein [bacterium]